MFAENIAALVSKLCKIVGLTVTLGFALAVAVAHPLAPGDPVAADGQRSATSIGKLFSTNNRRAIGKVLLGSFLVQMARLQREGQRTHRHHRAHRLPLDVRRIQLRILVYLSVQGNRQRRHEQVIELAKLSNQSVNSASRFERPRSRDIQKESKR